MSKGKYKRTEKWKDSLRKWNKSRKGSKSGLFGSRVHGRLMSFLYLTELKEADNKTIEEYTNLNTWATKLKNELKKLNIIEYKKKSGGRGSKFSINHKDVQEIIKKEYKKYFESYILLEIKRKVSKLFRLHSKTTIHKSEILKEQKKKYLKDTQTVGVFGYIMDSMSEGNEFSRVSSDLNTMQRMSLDLMEGRLKVSEHEEAVIMENYSRLEKLKKAIGGKQIKGLELLFAKKKEKEIREVLKKIKDDIYLEQDFDLDINLFVNAQAFINIKFKDYSIYDIFEEVVFQQALMFKNKDIQLKGKDKHFLLCWLYQTMVASDFEM